MAQPTALTNLHWLRDAPDEEVAAEPLPASAEVVIVGAGYVGSATAYWLARRGVEALVVERRLPATGATGRNAGFIAPGLGMAFPEAVGRYGMSAAVERMEFTRAGRTLALELIEACGIECELEANGGLTLAASPEEWVALRASGEALRSAGFPFEILSREELRAHLHTDVPERFEGALFNPETLLVNPAKLARGILGAALSSGARLAERCDVVALSDLADGRVAVETSRGEVVARRVVLATNAWSPLLAGFFKDRIVPVRGQVLATEPAPPVFRRAMSTNWGYEYWSQRADGAIVLGGARWAAANRDEGYYAEEVNPTIQDALYRFLTETFPVLVEVGVSRRWSGIMGFSRDGYPFIGALPGRSGLLVAAGFTGHGGPYFAVAGKCLAELIVDGRTVLPLHHFDPGRDLPA